MKDVLKGCPDYFAVLSGDDNLTVDLIKSGGHGVISVASNLIPRELTTMVSSALRGDFGQADQLNAKYLPLFEGIFIETNPIPVKAVLAMQGLIKETYRLPMCELNPKNRERLAVLVKELGVI